MFTLLDAFGNSRTVMNTSATRYTSLLSLDFDHAGIIASASVQVSVDHAVIILCLVMTLIVMLLLGDDVDCYDVARR